MCGYWISERFWVHNLDSIKATEVLFRLRPLLDSKLGFQETKLWHIVNSCVVALNSELWPIVCSQLLQNFKISKM